jgi:hypothetical protein
MEARRILAPTDFSEGAKRVVVERVVRTASCPVLTLGPTAAAACHSGHR